MIRPGSIATLSSVQPLITCVPPPFLKHKRRIAEPPSNPSLPSSQQSLHNKDARPRQTHTAPLRGFHEKAAEPPDTRGRRGGYHRLSSRVHNGSAAHSLSSRSTTAVHSVAVVLELHRLSHNKATTAKNRQTKPASAALLASPRKSSEGLMSARDSLEPYFNASLARRRRTRNFLRLAISSTGWQCGDVDVPSRET